MQTASALIDAHFTIKYRYLIKLQNELVPLKEAYDIALSKDEEAKPGEDLVKLNLEIPKMVALVPQLVQALKKQQTLANSDDVRHDGDKIKAFLEDIVTKLSEMREEADDPHTRNHLLQMEGHDLKKRFEKLIGADYFLEHLVLKITAVEREIRLSKDLIKDVLVKNPLLERLSVAITTLTGAKVVVTHHKAATLKHIMTHKDQRQGNPNTPKEVEDLGGFFEKIGAVETLIKDVKNALPLKVE